MTLSSFPYTQSPFFDPLTPKYLTNYIIKYTRNHTKSLSTSSSFICIVNSWFRSNSIDWRHNDARYHRFTAHPLDGRILLVETQTIAAWVCWADRWKRDKQWKSEIPTVVGESTARAAAFRATEATSATAATSGCTAQQYQQKAQRVPEP